MDQASVKSSLAGVALLPGEGSLYGDIVHIRTHKHVTTSLADWKGQRVLIKRYPALSGFKSRFKQFFRGSPARCAVKGSLLLLEHGLTAPKPMALIEKNKAYIIRQSAAVFEYCSDHEQLYDRLSAENTCRNLVYSLAQEVAKMHSRGIVHGDMNLHNILVPPKFNGKNFVWTDNRKNKRVFWIKQRNIVRNFSQLFAHLPANLNKLSQQRFLALYRRERNLSRSCMRSIISKIQKRLEGRHRVSATPDCCKRN